MTEPTEERLLVSAEDVAQRYALEQTRMSLESGFLGKCFGSAANAPTNIAEFVVCLLVVIICVVGFLKMPTAELVERVIPIITLALGYLFGKNTRTE